jgi:hypothetical protein
LVWGSFLSGSISTLSYLIFNLLNWKIKCICLIFFV